MMNIETFFDTRTYTLTYVVWDSETRDAVIIDPVLDYEPASSKTWTESVEQVIEFAKGKELHVHYVLETHAHADHLSGSQTLKAHFPNAKVAIGERIKDVQSVFKAVFDLPKDFPTDGSQFDQLLEEGKTYKAGSLEFKAIFTPGHTPACATFQIEDAIFTGDALFMPDQGVGRCDFPAGSAAGLYKSVQEKLYTLPDETRVFVGHDYQPGGRDVEWESTVKEQRESNVHLRGDMTEKEFVEFRNKRDATLSAPKLLFQSVQVNVDAGHLPQPHDNEIRYLKIPINVFKPKPNTGEVELRAVRPA